jgi:large subunit ribosomal protein L24
MLVCPRCNEVTRVEHQVLADGTKLRACKHCSQTID